MKFRLLLAGSHFLLSLLLLSLILLAFYLDYYAGPASFLLGVSSIALILVLVDVCLGPLATLVVANPAKRRAELVRDLAVVALIQLVALAYGVSALWAGRPAFYVFSVDRIELIQASDLPPDTRSVAQAGIPELCQGVLCAPSWVWAPLPDNPDETQLLLQSIMQGGPDVSFLPSLYRPFGQGLPVLKARLKPIADLRNKKPDLFPHEKYQEILRREALAEAELGYLPVQARGHDGVFLFHRKHGQLIGFLAVSPW